MKMTIGDYELDIKAKRKFRARGDRKETMHFLNMISMWARESSENLEKQGLEYLAARDARAATEIYKQLEAKGLYKNL